MRTLMLLVLLCLACAAYIVGFDNVPREQPAPASDNSAASQQPGYCNPPTIAAVEDGASDSSTLSPGSIAVIFWCENTVPLPATPVTSVLVNGSPSYLFPAPATPVTSALANSQPSFLQVRVQIPVSAKPGDATVQLKRKTQVLAQTEIDLSKFAPGIFTVDESGHGLALADHSNGSLITAACPATAGEVVTIYAEGLGPTTPAVATGALPPQGKLATTNTAPVVTVGSNEAQYVIFAGLSPTLIGVYQINFVVPDGGSGQLPLQLQIGPKSSNKAQLPVGKNSCAP
jgi:uncharacterized protein (TIGR03437 family)